jgi:hypothetical protein
MQTPCINALQRLYRLRFFHFLTALFASPACIIAPEFEHCLAKMVDDVFAIEVHVFHQCSTTFTVENDVFLFTRRPAPFHDQANGVWRSLGRVRHIGRNEKRFALVDNVINDAIAFANTHLNVAFELIEILFRINQMKIVPRVGAFDDHHKKISAIIKIPVAYWRLKFLSILFNPLLYVDRRLHSGHKHERISARAKRQTRFCRAKPNGSTSAAETRRFSEATTQPIKSDFRVE